MYHINDTILTYTCYTAEHKPLLMQRRHELQAPPLHKGGLAISDDIILHNLMAIGSPPITWDKNILAYRGCTMVHPCLTLRGIQAWWYVCMYYPSPMSLITEVVHTKWKIHTDTCPCSTVNPQPHAKDVITKSMYPNNPNITHLNMSMHHSRNSMANAI